MDHVFAGHDQSHVAIHGNVQFVNFLATVGLLKPPHPLLANHINVERVRGSVPIIHINRSAPSKHCQEEEKRQHDPGDFQPQVAMDRYADFIGIFALIFKEEVNHRRANRHREKQAYGNHEENQVVHLWSEVRSLLRIQWHLRLHDQSAPWWLKFRLAARLSRWR